MHHAELNNANQDYLSSLYRTYRSQMFYTARSVLGNDDDAEDAVHSVFLRLTSSHLQTIRAIGDDRRRRNYLLKAAKNTALNILTQKKRIFDTDIPFLNHFFILPIRIILRR